VDALRGVQGVQRRVHLSVGSTAGSDRVLLVGKVDAGQNGLRGQKTSEEACKETQQKGAALGKLQQAAGRHKEGKFFQTEKAKSTGTAAG
jgi:hypothetical protein